MIDVETLRRRLLSGSALTPLSMAQFGDIMAALDELEAARKALGLVLMFHRGGPWLPVHTAHWKAITAAEAVTTKVMCDYIRKVLGKDG